MVETHFVSAFMPWFTGFFGGGLWWWVRSANEPLRPTVVSIHQIKDVIFPDESKAQMFTCDGKHLNVTEIFGKLVEAKDWQVRRVRWAAVYFGVSWHGTSDRQYKEDFYYLEHKTSDHQVEMKEIKK